MLCSATVKAKGVLNIFEAGVVQRHELRSITIDTFLEIGVTWMRKKMIPHYHLSSVDRGHKKLDLMSSLYVRFYIHAHVNFYLYALIWLIIFNHGYT